MNASVAMNTLPVKRQLELLALPAAKKRRILSQVGRALQQQTRCNIRQQKTITGQPMQGRSANAKPAKKRRKLLRKLGKKLTQRTDANAVTVSFNGVAANIAAKHHYGDKQVVTVAGFKREMKARGQGEDYYDKPATKEQAGALVKQLGYKRPSASGKPIRVSQRWIRDNMTIGMAGAIIADMRIAKGLPTRSGKSWVVETPARPFFAGTQQWVNDTVHDIFAREIPRQLNS